MKKKIIIISGDPNSINSELIYKCWKKLSKKIRRNIYIISNIDLLKKQFFKLGYPIKLSKVKSIDELCSALDNRLSPHTKRGLNSGKLILQPTRERRRSGSHYTPRALTEPIVKETFRPWLEENNYEVNASKILNLKVCDPAMGSGAFLVASCRFLSDLLVKAWTRDGFPPEFDESFDK